MDKKKTWVLSGIFLVLAIIGSAAFSYYTSLERKEKEPEIEVPAEETPVDLEMVEMELEGVEPVEVGGVQVAVQPVEQRKQHTPFQSPCPDPFELPIIVEVPEGHTWQVVEPPTWLDFSRLEGTSSENSIDLNFNCNVESVEPHTEHAQVRVDVFDRNGDLATDSFFDVYLEILPQE